MDPDLVVYFDGGCVANPGKIAAGAVVLSPQGELLSELARWVGEGTNNAAEYRGLRHAITMAQLFGARRPLFYSDSLIVVRQINGYWAIRGDLNREHAACTSALMDFDEWALRHVPRERNQRADWIINRLVRGDDHRRTLKTAPEPPSVNDVGEIEAKPGWKEIPCGR